MPRFAGIPVDEADQEPIVGTLPSTGRPMLQNPDGSVSTERSITVTDPRLNGGRPTNIPSIWNGRQLDDQGAIAAALQSGQQFQGFDSIPEAVSAAEARSAMLGQEVDALQNGTRKPRFSGVPVETDTVPQVPSPTPVPANTGAPAIVRALVGGAPNPASRLATLRRFYPDAQPDPKDPENFVFTDPQTGKPTYYNPKGPDLGDLASIAREGAQMVGATLGAGQGALTGSAAGPVGTFAGGVTGAGLGGAAGEEAFNAAARAAGMVDDRTLGQRFADTGQTALMNSAGEAGGMSVGALLASAGRALLRGGPQGAAKTAQTVRDFQSIGASPTVGQATEKRAIDAAEGILSRQPGGSAVFARRAQDTIDKLDAALTRQAQKLGGTRLEPEVAGRAIVQGVEGQGGFIPRFKSQSGQLYGEIDKFIKPDAAVPAGNTRAYLAAATKPIQGAEQTSASRLFSNPLLDDVAKRFEADAAANNGAIPYGTLKEMRSRVGERLTTPQLTDEIPRQELKRLYAALSTDMEAAAQAAGPAAERAFRRANGYFSAGMKRVEDVLQPLVDKGVPEKIFKSIEAGGREGATTIRATMRSLTRDQRDIVAGTIINRLGKATPGQQNAVGEAFSPETFLTNWNKLSGEAKDALFGGTSDTGLRGGLDTIARVAEKIRANSRVFDNPSGTAGNVVGQSLSFVGLGSLATGNYELAGVLLGGLAASNGTARLLTWPKFVNWLAQSTRIKPNGFSAYLGRLAGIAADSDPETRAAIRDYLSGFAAGADQQPEVPVR